jgi:Na+/proline symporter
VTDRYHSETLRLIILAALWVSDFLYLAGQFSAISSLVETVTEDEVPGYAGALFMGGVILVLESLGGLKSVMLTDAIQSAFMIFSFIVVPFLLSEIYGGFGALLESRQCGEAAAGSCGLNEQADPYKQYPSTMQTTGMASQLFGFLSYAILPQCIHRIYTSDTADSLRITVASIAFCPYFTMIPGIFMGLVCAARLNEDSDGTAFGIISGELYDRGGFQQAVSCVMMCAGLAAISSTADSALIAMSHLVSEDLYQKKFRPNATQTETVLVSKVCSLVVVMLAICVTLVEGFDVSKAAQIQIGFQIQAFPVFFFGLFPEICGHSLSSRSLIWGFVSSIVVIVSVYVSVLAGRHLFFDPGTWGFAAYMVHIFVYEKFFSADEASYDDNIRTFDRPPEKAYAHFPNEKFAPPGYADSSSSSSKEAAAAVPPAALPAAPHGASARLTDRDVLAMAGLNLNEPFGSKTKKLIVTAIGVMLILFLPWYEEPDSETDFSSGWPRWAIIFISYVAAATTAITLLLWQWEVLEHQQDIDTLATTENPITGGTDGGGRDTSTKNGLELRNS